MSQESKIKKTQIYKRLKKINLYGEKERGLWGWARQGYAFHLFGVLKCKEREKEDKRAHFLPLAEFRHNHLS